ncbi:MAG: Periplasmic solute binding protein [Candidatus Nomurabacteria bacterium GW2011_GWE1_32_28]|uniref:Periplasmic solute binding protein n=1 Tax=Candidatus Nomurabacteria bacterium GW2011_GWF1_31_48 TaxID=1618767 RepID=A0A0G0AV00_9BACT|nr:MAG: Periplasmic solute binding protein [Candidatus Nomurabacteria bacterium GW2011_GWF2_30_133]KKP29085.1 MAG: Periplasmic solute binding protein [Candidatus Nomurabacteria bacterium GW2011_GWE2_31_40]KKP30505.1 MAG: Periplasmic solute binding protein [Candidatus Nomurabacteria bacterium GW2011_GWF1_31_48]KKP34990.1 MAG: Periplasmic solute binding protein [Candidatus Nomurabacteria bacterium GW2011_GWE1_32_28]HAS80642.1 ABC transporter substrate-binding protein [Candidatus Nomurabacteria ba
MNKKYIIALSILIILIVSFFVLFSNKKEKVVSDDKIKVVTSFYPLYFFTSEIAGDRATVLNIIPSGAGPHGYEPTARDMATIEDSDLLILNGIGLEGWGDNIKTNLEDKDTYIVIAGEGLATIEKKGEEEHEENNNNGIDPHIWLSPVLAIQMADKIESGLSIVDPKNSYYYKSNTEILKKKLNILDEEFKQSLTTCGSKNIIVSHSAFAYLAQEYNLNQISIAGLSHEEEPSQKEMTEISKFAKENNVKYIFFENLVSPKLSEAIAREIGAKTLVLDPIGGLTDNEISEGKDYFSEMRNNLVNLKIALECI